MEKHIQIREDLIDDLSNYDKDYLIKSLICFLPQSQLEELKDSIDIKLRNNHASINVDYQYNIFENNNQIFH